MKVKRKRSDKTALLVYCTREEAEKIRLAAKQEHRTISGFVLHVVTKRLEAKARLQQALKPPQT